MTNTNTSEELIVHAYEWDVIDECIETDHTAIYAWCFNRESKPCLLRFHDFPVFCHIELPYYVDHHPYRWDEESAMHVSKWLTNALGDNGPERTIFKQAKKIYYYRGNRTYPMLLAIFPTVKAMQKCEEFLQKQKDIPNIGLCTLKVWETQISVIRKLLTLQKCKYAQWFKIQALPVPPEDRISPLDLEYIAHWRTLQPIPLDQTKSWTTHPGILAFDIECYSDNHRAMPNPYCARHVAYMISCIYQKSGLRDTRKRYVIIMGECHDIEGVEVIRVKDEVEMCKEFARLVRELDPEILTGFNIFSFDYPYLDTRLKRKLQDWDFMGRITDKKPWLRSNTWQSSAYGHQDLNILQLDGRITIDMLSIIRRDHKLPKYDLDTVSKHFLKRGKHDIKPVEMFQIYERQNIDDMTRVTKYCIEDSELTLDLFELTNTWIGSVELSNVVGVTIMELFTRGQQVRCLSLIYDMASNLGYVLDKRISNIQTFTGGAVQDPVAGLYENVPCLDFKSLYPSIIQAFNICYTTLIPPELDKHIPDDKCHVIEWDDVDVDGDDDDEDEDEEEEEDEGKKKENKEKKEKKHYRFKFWKGTPGILPKLAGDLVKERRAVVAAQKVEKDPIIQVVLDRRQWALKITANSIFGFLGAAQKGRLPLPEAAMSITAKGRELITMCKEFIEKTYGARTIYGDTDSIMFQAAKKQTPAEALAWGKEVEKEVNKLFGDSPLQVELEKVGMIFSLKKKKYAFWPLDPKTNDYKRTETGDPDLIARGIILARRENCLWQRQFYNKVLFNIMNRKSLHDTYNLILDECFQLLQGQVSWNNLVMIQQLGANYKQSNYCMKILSDELRRIGKPANPGDRLSYLIVNSYGVTGKQLLGYKMRLPETYLERLESENPEFIDYYYYLEKKVMNCIEQLFSIAYKDELAQMLESYKQRDLNRFFTFLYNSLPQFNDYFKEVENYYRELNPDLSIDQIHHKIIVHLTSKEIPAKMRNFCKQLNTRFITRRNQVYCRITNRPIKDLLKLIDHRQKILTQIKSPSN